MEELLERIKYFLELNKKKIILISFIILLFIISITGIYYFNNLKSETKEVIEELEKVEEVEEEPKEEKEEVQEEIKMVYVDIKGEVKKPGVYQVSENAIINDVIKKAGGLTKNASTLVNNLSRKVHDEMVIVIYSKKEIEEFSKTKEKEEIIIENSTIIKDTLINDSVIDNTDIDTNTNIIDKEEINVEVEEEKEVIENTDTTDSNKISINNASIDELMTISGIGEAKAKAIIEYRNTNGSFKSIEDIKNVSGIGESLYEKIKDHITL